MRLQVGVIGGDRRQAELARLLREDGNAVFTWGLCQEDEGDSPLEQTLSAEVLLLPLPICWKEGELNCQKERLPAEKLLESLRKGQLVLAGKIPEFMARKAEETGIELIDYFEREELTIDNAVPTAEGAIQLAMEELPKTICGRSVLVLGYGRIGKILAHHLRALGAQVTVAARTYEARAWAAAYGCNTLDIQQMDKKLNGIEVLFNTVPAMVVKPELLRQLRSDCLYLDVASVPGTDFELAEQLGIKAVWARGLPGKLSPVSAAEAIRDAVYHILEEQGGTR